MPTPKKGARLGGSPSHHNMMVSNLATELFRHGRIKTTKSKAKTMQPVAERMITFAKRGDLHARRQVLTVIRDKDVVHKLFADIGPASADRNGGYTRIVNIGHRKGDNAPMAMIELVDITDDDEGTSTLTEAPSRRWSLRRRRNNMSKAAREREEAIMAAEDAGEDTYVDPSFDDDELDDDDDSLAAAQITERELSARSADDSDDSDGPEVSPEDVEARLAEDDSDDVAEDDVAEAEVAEAEVAEAEVAEDDVAEDDVADDDIAAADDSDADDDDPSADEEE